MRNTLLLMKKLAGISAMAVVILALSNKGYGQNYCSDIYEPNDSKPNASLMVINQGCQGLIATTLDVDWFKFEVSAGQQNVLVTLSDLPKNYNLFLYNSSNVKIGASKNKNTASDTIVTNELASGTYYVKVRGKAGTFDPENCYSLKAETSSSPFKQTGNVSDFVSADSQFELYPNPVSDKLFIQCDDENISSVTFSIFNLTGQKISETKETMSGNTNAIIDVQSLNAGEYFLQISSVDGVEVKKFVVSK